MLLSGLHLWEYVSSGLLRSCVMSVLYGRSTIWSLIAALQLQQVQTPCQQCYSGLSMGAVLALMDMFALDGSKHCACVAAAGPDIHKSCRLYSNY